MQRYPGQNVEGDKAVKNLATFCNILALVMTFLTVQSFMRMLNTQIGIKHTQHWEDAQFWQKSSCKVVTAGVSCVEDDSGSTCGYLGKNISKLAAVKGALFFDWEFLSVCPGTYWCAVEGQTCTCDGTVTYAAELFDGKNVFDHPDLTYIVNGAIKCGTDKDGQLYADPAPYHNKHCFCTPRQVLEKLHAKTLSINNVNRALHINDFSRCAKEANSDFLGEQIESPQVAARRLTSSPRRRRTYSYTPWALVEVQAEHGLDTSKTVLTCAYEYGSPQASQGVYQGTADGTGGTDFKSLVGDWISKETCTVRMPGQSGADTCAVSFGNLGGLTEIQKSTIWWSRVWMIVFLIASLPCCACAFMSGRAALAIMMMEMRGQSDQTQGSQQAASSLMQPGQYEAVPTSTSQT